ncbi:F-box protein SKIP24 [Vigna angularis]|uniref:F-box protein SKIP24 n=1 Tax=Phaseolus angularis TaxID=3914 RepID=UPI0022B5729A|nr:F-box protein SKIP24 [Vigna angularis]
MDDEKAAIIAFEHFVGIRRMSFLPEELWRRILEIGIESSGFSYKDLCCVSISCRRLHRLSSEDLLWNRLLSADYPQPHPSSSTSSKSLYKLRFERDKERRIAAHRRAVLRKESQIAEHSRKLREIQTRVAQETATATQTAQDLSNLRRARQAFVALNVWQPEVVRSRQKQMVEQSAVPAECRIHALEMELKLCKQQIAGLELFYKDEKRRLDTAKEELASMKYHPMEERKTISQRDNKHVKRKKLKICNS